LLQAEATLKDNEKVKQSLGEINVPSLAAILIKERWTSAYISDYFSDADIQSLDFPKLHYLAGKTFFIGANLPLKHFLNAETTAYLGEYLFYKQCENWTIAPDTKKAFYALVESTRSLIEYDKTLPITKALLHRAYLNDHEKYPLSQELLSEFRDDLLAFTARYPETEKEWTFVGLASASIRQKAETLLDNIEQSRNWMVPYPLDGIIELLQKGRYEGKDAYEKNWCALQLAVLLSKERFERDLIDEILNKTVKGPDGEIILKEEDRHLLKILEPKKIKKS
jgi:hypothetical protein